MATKSKANTTLPLAGNVAQKVQSDSSDGSIRPMNYNESFSGGGYPSAFVTTGDNLISSVPARICQIQCFTASTPVTVAVYDLATASHASGLIYGPVPLVPGAQVRPMIQTTTGISILVTGTGTFSATIEL